MIKKFTLNLDTVTVESFTTGSYTRSGTINAHSEEATIGQVTCVANQTCGAFCVDTGTSLGGGTLPATLQNTVCQQHTCGPVNTCQDACTPTCPTVWILCNGTALCNG